MTVENIERSVAGPCGFRGMSRLGEYETLQDLLTSAHERADVVRAPGIEARPSQ